MVINRRDFLKLLGLLGASLIIPKGNDMEYLFDKFLRGETLSSNERNELKQWMITTHQNNTFVSGLQNKSSSINVLNIDSFSGSFTNPPNKASLYTTIYDDARSNYQTIPANTYTILDDVWGYSYENPDSVVKAYDLAAGKFQINQIYSNSKRFTFSFFGSINCYSGFTSSLRSEAWLVLKNKSNDVEVLRYSLSVGRNANLPVTGNLTYSIDITSKIEDLYFQIEVLFDNGSATQFFSQADIVFFRTF